MRFKLIPTADSGTTLRRVYTMADLPAEHQAVVLAYAAKHGRKWKAALANAWGMGTDTAFPDGWALRDIRNSPAWGHAWLDGVTL
jgi:hypothetical protein